jgi:hypoxanthine phosphoribosyltransferase
VNKLPRCLIPRDRLQGRVSALGGRISDDYRDTGVDLVVVLKGAAIFGADLARAIDPAVDARLYFMSAASYDGRESSGVLQTSGFPNGAGKERPILFVEDIVDTGLTAHSLLQMAGPRARLCTLLDKPSRRLPKHPVNPQYVGFTIPDVFVVGYGLDDDQRLRHLGWVGVVESA